MASLLDGDSSEQVPIATMTLTAAAPALGYGTTKAVRYEQPTADLSPNVT